MADTPGIISSEVAASLLTLPDGTADLRRLEKAGYIKPVGTDRWRLVDVVQGYIKRLRDEMAAGDKNWTKQAAPWELPGRRRSKRAVDEQIKRQKRGPAEA